MLILFAVLSRDVLVFLNRSLFLVVASSLPAVFFVEFKVFKYVCPPVVEVRYVRSAVVKI